MTHMPNESAINPVIFSWIIKMVSETFQKNGFCFAIFVLPSKVTLRASQAAKRQIHLRVQLDTTISSSECEKPCVTLILF